MSLARYMPSGPPEQPLQSQRGSKVPLLLLHSVIQTGLVVGCGLVAWPPYSCDEIAYTNGEATGSLTMAVVKGLVRGHFELSQQKSLTGRPDAWIVGPRTLMKSTACAGVDNMDA